MTDTNTDIVLDKDVTPVAAQGYVMISSEVNF